MKNLAYGSIQRPSTLNSGKNISLRRTIPDAKLLVM